MTSPENHLSSDLISNVLDSVRKKGVRLWFEAGQLRYRAPKGALTSEEIERIRESSRQIVALLARAADAEPTVAVSPSSAQIYHAPLAFSQLAHWQQYGLHKRHAVRQIASAVRLHGRLQLDVLQESLDQVVRRHAALRTRIVLRDGVPIQEVSDSVECELELIEMTNGSINEQEGSIQRSIDQLILEPIDLAIGPLIGIRLLRFRGDDHLLIVALQHIISDESSLKILLNELFACYTRAVTGSPLRLPEIRVQFPEYARCQRKAIGSWLEQHGSYWNERLAGCKRLRFPEDHLPTPTSLGWGAAPLCIKRELKVALREWCRVRRTTLAMAVFTVYVALTLRWCNVPQAIIQYETDGRVNPATENTIGYFASTLYLRLELLDTDSFCDLLNRVTREYCNAHRHADFSYMQTCTPTPEFTLNSCFNWVPHGNRFTFPGSSSSQDAKNSIAHSPIAFKHPWLKIIEGDSEPLFLLYDTDEEIIGDVYFPLDKFAAGSMERLVRNFFVLIKALVSQPMQRIKDIPIV